jgi:hypothetical protein
VLRRPGFNGLSMTWKRRSPTPMRKNSIGKRALGNLDCFHYAYEKVADGPLLTLDQKLRETDMKPCRDD